MADREKIEAAGIAKNNTKYLYYIKNGRVYRVRKKQQRPVEVSSEPEVAYDGEIKQDPDYIYFVDEDGDIARVPRAKGGRRSSPGYKKGTPTSKKTPTKPRRRPVSKAAKRPKSQKKKRKKQRS
jgi:hypothetical protein